MSTPVERLSNAWATRPGFVGWLSDVNHRSIGKRYIVTSFIFFLLGGMLALLMRLQLTRPELEILSPAAFNQFFTMHGTVMMFLFAIPMLEGLGIYFVPLMVGARDMAFPRLNAFAYWVYLFGGIILFAAFFMGRGPDAGWFNYTPLSGPGFSPSLTDVSGAPLGEAIPGRGIDYFLIAVTMLEVAALAAAIELIVTILKLRAPGMALQRMPLFVWAQLVTGLMIIVAMPALMTVSVMLELDRKIGTQFFNVAAGGSSFLWQHLFWFFGHPDVYIMLLPAFGVISTVIAVAVARPISGYLLVAMSTVAIGFLSFGLWVHHMYAGGIALMGLSFFAAASMMITIPSGIQVFAWITTIWRGPLTVSTAFMFAVGTILVFVLGGITGVMVASPAFDWQVHDTYFVVAHFHYVILGGVILPIFAALYHWLPKITGRLLSERLGMWNFWFIFIGTNLTFFPMHQLGFEGMPRRVYTYLPDLGFDDMNLLATIGGFLFGIGTLIFMVNVGISLWRGAPAGNDPWNGGTLEWATSSPPPSYNFANIPVVSSRHPIWQQEGIDPPGDRVPESWRSLSDSLHGERATYVTSTLEARPVARAFLPYPSILPFWAAVLVAVIFSSFLPLVGSDVELYLLPIGALALYAVGLAWAWPTSRISPAGFAEQLEAPGLLPHKSTGRDSLIWWGVIWLIIIEIVVLGCLIFSYFYLRIGVAEWPPLDVVLPPWPPDGFANPPLVQPAIAGAVLLLSAIAVFIGNRGIQAGRSRLMLGGWIAAGILAIVSLVIAILEILDRPFGVSAHAYASIVWVLSGFHVLHVAMLILLAGPMLVLILRGHFNDGGFSGLQGVSMYWYFVVATWIPYYATVYIAPYLT